MAIVSLINDAQVIEHGQLVIEPTICVSAPCVTFNVWNRRFTVDLSGARTHNYPHSAEYPCNDIHQVLQGSGLKHGALQQ